MHDTLCRLVVFPIIFISLTAHVGIYVLVHNTREMDSEGRSSRESWTKTYTITRHYYTKVLTQTKRTEQSLDVYEPHHKLSPTTIVLVMGSGWLGHVWWVYAGTNWWNASGPATIARLGYRCISVRHSGGFFQVPTIQTCFRYPWLFLAVLVILTSSMQSALETKPSVPACGAISAMLVIWMFLQWQATGAAYLDDMVNDVADAFRYIHHDLGQQKIVVGGYSSGGHVVATWLSRQKETPPWIHGVLYLSGVLSLDSTLMNAVTLTVFGQWAYRIPSPYTRSIHCESLPPPPHLPHLIIGCHEETFGIPILDKTFCAQVYADQLRAPAKCVLVDSNHWSVLSSRTLSNALQKYLPWLLQESNHIQTTSQPNLESTTSMIGSGCSYSSDDASISLGEEECS